MPPDRQQPETYNPLALITIVLASLLLFAAFFLTFLVAPLAILTIFYVGFAASDRSRQRRGAAGHDQGPHPVVAPAAPDPRGRPPLTAEERLAIEQAQRRAGTHG